MFNKGDRVKHISGAEGEVLDYPLPGTVRVKRKDGFIASAKEEDFILLQDTPEDLCDILEEISDEDWHVCEAGAQLRLAEKQYQTWSVCKICGVALECVEAS